ncbi:MAG: glutamate--cysteine ligase [Candidatus Nanopelagicales bacterium]|nr:glutamate--cysteine ligase [Candidatus Nanopelagicales bacterium]MDZ4250715.1 glutamate--cysteine ligase [Candidatus Nanopelagicales bacterium]
MAIEFHPSPARTLGVEVELGIVDRETGELVPAATEIIDALTVDTPGEEHPKAKHELFLSTIEIITGICDTAAEAHADLLATVAELNTVLEPRGLALMGGGVHPFADPKTLIRSPSERYQQLVDRVQWPARRLQIHGVHFHVGVGDAEQAIQIMNDLMAYLPHFVALSAASPFWEGEDTGLASVRTKIFEALPTAGLPAYFPDWSAFEVFIDAMLATDSIGSIREIWWDMRPHVLFGTLEFRMSDGMATLREATALAAMAQCLVDYLDEAITAGRAPGEPFGWVIRENKWRAARWGLEAQLVEPDGRLLPIRDEIGKLIDTLMPTAEKLNCVAELSSVREILANGASYARQRAVIERGGTLRDVVSLLVREFETDRPGG